MTAARLTAALQAWEVVILFYFVALNSIYLLYCGIALVRLIEHRRRWTPRRLEAVLRSPATPGISVIAPAYNEEATIRESVRSLLLLHYPQFEVLVVNDGSKDRTLAELTAAFGLIPAPAGYAQPLETQPVRGVYRSLANPDLVVIDKVNGGKADAINAGINAARHPLVCVIDADSLLEDNALTRAVLPFIEDPSTLASGGIIRIANGCTVESGRVVRVGLPRSWLARFQVVEYLRAFLAGRVAQSAMNGLLIISGAFGLFRREPVVETGGFLHGTVGEDMEIVTRLHRHAREAGRPYRITFQPDPVCWTEVPEKMRVLRTQRNRWQRGTLQVLDHHRAMIGRPRYGVVGMVTMPYYVVFEAAGPVIELSGYLLTAAAIAVGVLDWRFAELLFLAAVLYGALISLAAVLLEEVSFRRYPRLRDLLLLASIGVIENFGYRQLTTWWRMRGVIDFFLNRRGWGAMPRKGFARV
ncbi:MAG: glycosyl transferase [Acidobacteria bacterium RIFCSPLOWO2_02_FULL_68_18]|nr:MAG: glycosyl transferase [Acidobacteria bacterium RIFCSPLOWO2_02_FULL_68_18]OFW50947.1 MAG: glycosyl transferase [Acidobacteria bacterium RIFCSPLOWO2_12_FULL_68_19]